MLHFPVPDRLCGCVQLWQLPATRCLTAEEFESAQRKEREGVDAEELTADAVEAEEEEQEGRGGEGEASGGTNGGPGGSKGRRRKGPTLKERLERCLRTERERLTFGKVCKQPPWHYVIKVILSCTGALDLIGLGRLMMHTHLCC